MAASRGPLSGLVENFKPGGLHAAIGILAALHHRARTGGGPAPGRQPAVVGAVGHGEPERLAGRPGSRMTAPDDRDEQPDVRAGESHESAT